MEVFDGRRFGSHSGLVQYHGRFFYISSGFLVLLAAIAFLQNWKGNCKLLWFANIVGLTDILVIVIGICCWAWADLGPHRNMNYVVFGVGPMLLWIHYNSIR